MVALLVPLIEKHIERLNYSKDEDGTITWMLSKPVIEEIKISDYMI